MKKLLIAISLSFVFCVGCETVEKKQQRYNDKLTLAKKNCDGGVTYKIRTGRGYAYFYDFRCIPNGVQVVVVED